MLKAHVLHGHREVRGVPIAIENRKGSLRHWTDAATSEKRTTKLRHSYGSCRARVRLTEGSRQGAG
jgi:hypothetical protein